VLRSWCCAESEPYCRMCMCHVSWCVVCRARLCVYMLYVYALLCVCVRAVCVMCDVALVVAPTITQAGRASAYASAIKTNARNNSTTAIK
jgi:hypothetical protein